MCKLKAKKCENQTLSKFSPTPSNLYPLIATKLFPRILTRRTILPRLIHKNPFIYLKRFSDLNVFCLTAPGSQKGGRDLVSLLSGTRRLSIDHLRDKYLQKVRQGTERSLLVHSSATTWAHRMSS
ncbi:hypothetical protein RRG08_049165 [Elysia crispata]|uniref:Uncharacterized protein n=1 Tax=Elysia crispata TaxID=231223 RepID=A0AAE1E336_9GAST|nr:hypothetical protein RRG08_049165 [Elysia crispata]